MRAGSLEFKVPGASDLSMDERGREGVEGCGMERGRDRAEIQLSPLSFLTWRGRPLGPTPPQIPFSSKWAGYTHTHTLTEARGVAGPVSAADHEGSVHINHTRLSQGPSQLT